MNKIFALMVTAAVGLSAYATNASITSWPEGIADNVSVERTSKSILVRMDINTDILALKPNREVWIRPAIASDGDTLYLKPLVVAGRTRYFQHFRSRDIADGTPLLRSGEQSHYSYSAEVPYADWMELSEVVLTGKIDGCCGDFIGAIPPLNLSSLDYREKTIDPKLIYLTPYVVDEDVVKIRSKSGEAYIDFPVSKMEIMPDYRRNPTELAEIRRTIDEVQNDPDITITSISFKGYASPEGSYELNERLAKGRTEALIEYVRSLYSFPSDLMHASWEAEDWSGLDRRVRNLDIANREQLLSIITDTVLAPDQRELRLKKSYPEQYRYLLAEIYPSLRHSDYNIEYQIRNFTEISEIAEIMSTDPRKLSLEELFFYAQSLDKTSPEFREVMEVAVRMYPDNPVANLNSATMAVERGDFNRAKEYLAKAGDTPTAVYLAGVIEAKQGNYAAAAPLLELAAKCGISEATDLLSTMRKWGWIE